MKGECKMDNLRNDNYIKELKKDFESLLWGIYTYKYETLDDDMPDKYDNIIGELESIVERITGLIEE
jgi:hypothetical protein